MPDEVKFLRALDNAKNYNYIDLEVEIASSTEPGVSFTVDNVAQKEETIFIFEGKASNLERAISQLKRDYLSFKYLREQLVRKGTLKPYNKLRLFYYSFKSGLLIEYDPKGKEVNQYRFNKNNIQELSNILRNI